MRLVVFDVDGTLVDSQGDIVASMTAAFDQVGLPVPSREEILGIVSLQVADDHPSKPHPAMLQAALAETGAEAGRAVMVGDTTFDMDMAASAGMAFIGVGWGYHAPVRLTGAREVVAQASDLPAAIARAIGEHA